jgi:hypothetical protein
VRAQEYELLLAACRRLVEKEPKLQKSVRESIERSAEGIREEIGDFIDFLFKEHEKIKSRALEDLQPLIMAYDFALLQVCDLSMFSWRNHESRVKIIWPKAPLPRRPNPTLGFYLLSSNLAQLLQAVRVLIVQGCEGQARGMFRSFIELANLTLAILADQDVYKSYITTYEDPKKRFRHWQTHLSPGVIRRRLKKLDEELDIASVTSIPAAEVREDTYEWFSLFSHVNMVAHMVSVYPTELGSETPLGPPRAMLGEAGTTAKETLARALLYLWFFFTHLDKLLWEKHGWNRFRGARWRGRYRYRSRAFDTFFRQNYATLQGIAEEGEGGAV